MTEQLDIIEWIEASVTPMDAPPLSSPAVELIRIDPTRNMRRFYAMHIERDLFGTVLLARNWGRIGVSRGRLRLDAYDTEEQAHQALMRLRQQKERKGYRS